jgi:formamidopyrimidine-DNA glycosylase
LPELPEVEIVVRGIRPRLQGQVIRAAHFHSRRVTRSPFAANRAALAGATITHVERRAKHILIHLDRGFLHVHLGMTGKLLWNGEPGPYTRAELELGKGRLLFDDVRQFGRFEFCRSLPVSVRKLGPDALAISLDDFHQRLQARSGAIKALLLNQTFLGGLGNIYIDESLFQAGINPRAKARRLSRIRVARLHSSIREVLTAAIEHRGSSISDYVDGDGEPGGFQNLHQVYGMKGSPCSRCGTAIRRIVIAQRGTHFCPRCQRA